MTAGNDDALLEELRSMEPVSASEGFTPRVVAALGRRRRQRRRRRQVGLGLAAMTLLALALTPLALEIRRKSGVERLAGEAESLRQEYQEIQAELEELEDRARQEGPILYLGGDDDVDFVLDLAAFMAQPAAARMTDAEAASYEF